MILFLLSCSHVKTMSSRLGLLLLACNIFICSIPRCDFLRALVLDTQDMLQADSKGKDSMQHCHGSSDSNSRDVEQLTAPGLCQCELLRFVSTLPPEPVRSVSHAHLSPLTWELSQLVMSARSSFIPAIEPPYPKA
jgi:hypothetical protein